MADAKDTLHRYLRAAGDAVVWKLDGLSEYDLRRPTTSTGTNLLGLVKHLAGVELGYFGLVFGRPSDEPMPGHEDGAEPNADMWATADEASDEVLARYRRAQAHADRTIDELSLDDSGHVPWWPEEANPVTLHRILVHVTAETNRHAGHADIVRELIDGSVGLRQDADNLPHMDDRWWTAHVEGIEAAARAAGQRAG
jgi:uncharacterized damage-inducible protein DinB